MEIDEKYKDDAEMKEIEAMIQHAINNDIETRFVKSLCGLFCEFLSAFSTRFSSIAL